MAPLGTGLQPPNASISPLIKTSRYAALFLGIAYGAYELRKLRNLEKIPVRRQEVIKEQLRVMQEEQRTKDNAEELIRLAPVFGVVPKKTE